MEEESLSQSPVPLNIVAFLLAPGCVSNSGLALGLTGSILGDLLFEHLTDLLPEGMACVAAAVPWSADAILMGYGSTGGLC